MFAMIASYFLSRTLVPTLVLLLMGGVHDAAKANAKPSPLQRLYRSFDAQFERVRRAYTLTLSAALSHRKRFAQIFLGFCMLSCLLYPLLGRDFFPSVDAGQIRLHMRAPTGTRVEETVRIADAVETTIREMIPADQLETILDNIGLPSSGINLYAMLNEAVADDANYITTPTPSTCEVKLSLGVDPVSSINHLPAIRCRGTSGTITVNLMQGATVKATFVLTVTPAFTTFTPTLTTIEIDSLTDYGDLHYRFTSAL